LGKNAEENVRRSAIEIERRGIKEDLGAVAAFLPIV
jgi:hypothetical protein